MLLQLGYRRIPAAYSARPAASCSGVIYKLPFGILRAKFFNVVGMRHTPAIPEAAAHGGAEPRGWILRDAESRGGLGGASLAA